MRKPWRRGPLVMRPVSRKRRLLAHDLGGRNGDDREEAKSRRDAVMVDGFPRDPDRTKVYRTTQPVNSSH